MEEQKHSGLGIASFTASIISGILIFMLFIFAGMGDKCAPGGIGEESTFAAVMGLFLLALLGVSLVALGLGIAGLIQKECKKIFAILGVVFSATSLVSATFFIVLGMTMGKG